MVVRLGLVLAFGIQAQAQSQLRDYDFQVVVPSAARDQALVQTIRGTERKNNSLNRLSIISESQYDYPEPESGCEPAPLLTILVWYKRYGLIEPLFRGLEPRECSVPQNSANAGTN